MHVCRDSVRLNRRPKEAREGKELQLDVMRNIRGVFVKPPLGGFCLSVSSVGGRYGDELIFTNNKYYRRVLNQSWMGLRSRGL